VKCEDPDWTNRSESDILRLMRGSRTKAGGSKSIRYRFSSSSKRCRLKDMFFIYFILYDFCSWWWWFWL